MDIPKDDPRHAAAQNVLNAMHEFWKLAPAGGAVQWIEDSDGRLVVFTRGEYRNKIRQAIGEALMPEQFFELEDEMIQYGVTLINRDGSESNHSIRWREWSDAANFGEKEVKEKRACGFRIFDEPSE